MTSKWQAHISKALSFFVCLFVCLLLLFFFCCFFLFCFFKNEKQTFLSQSGLCDEEDGLVAMKSTSIRVICVNPPSSVARVSPERTRRHTSLPIGTLIRWSFIPIHSRRRSPRAA